MPAYTPMVRVVTSRVEMEARKAITDLEHHWLNSSQQGREMIYSGAEN